MRDFGTGCPTADNLGAALAATGSTTEPGSALFADDAASLSRAAIPGMIVRKGKERGRRGGRSCRTFDVM